ncbi:hypothetical protein Syun_027864 [Stephania yunnanensis]|uniref:Uncharacterized protein n=1 Tax=Stephania yunnanensis TaxID=152371 RepID=A0AAP0HLE7_9MAGN
MEGLRESMGSGGVRSASGRWRGGGQGGEGVVAVAPRSRKSERRAFPRNCLAPSSRWEFGRNGSRSSGGGAGDVRERERESLRQRERERE